MVKKYLLYLVRWQLSTPILAVVLIFMADFDTITATVVANLVGGLIFFWVDRFIFRTLSKNPLWEIKNDTVCADCGARGCGYRIVEWLNYNRKQESNPQFRCEHCKDKKSTEVGKKVNRNLHRKTK